MISKIIIISTLAIALISCGSDSDSPKTDLGISPEVLTVSGQTVTLSGTFVTECYSPSDTDNYAIVTMNIAGATASLSTRGFLPSDTTCSGSSVDVDSPHFRFVATEQTTTTTGWVDLLGNPVSAPMAANGLGALSSNETVTLLDMEVTKSGFDFVAGQTGQGFLVVDDTGDSQILYFDHGYPGITDAESAPAWVKQ